jgi:hypothetical protein
MNEIGPRARGRFLTARLLIQAEVRDPILKGTYERLAQGLKLHAQILESRSAGTPGRSVSAPVSPSGTQR